MGVPCNFLALTFNLCPCKEVSLLAKVGDFVGKRSGTNRPAADIQGRGRDYYIDEIGLISGIV